MENKFRVLLVEDSKLAATMSKLNLEELDCLVVIAEDGKKAIEEVKKNDYNLVFMDIGLPDITGIEVSKRIRKLDIKNNNLTIVGLTANESNRDECLKAGMDDFITKPLEEENIKVILNKYKG